MGLLHTRTAGGQASAAVHAEEPELRRASHVRASPPRRKSIRAFRQASHFGCTDGRSKGWGSAGRGSSGRTASGDGRSFCLCYPPGANAPQELSGAPRSYCIGGEFSPDRQQPPRELPSSMTRKWGEYVDLQNRTM
eukprot:scaffold91132_cov32-Tisochrysis_lutea.AAC.3